MGLHMRHGRAQTAAVSPRPPRELTRKPPHRADPFCTGRAGEKRPRSNGDGISACPRTEPRVMLCTGHRHLAARLPDRRLPTRKPRRPACHRPRARSFGCSGRKQPSQPPLNQRGAQPPQATSTRTWPASSQAHACHVHQHRLQRAAHRHSAGLIHASTDPGNDPVPTRPPSAEQGAPHPPPG